MRLPLIAAAMLLAVAAPASAQACWGVPPAEGGFAMHAGVVSVDGSTGFATRAVLRGPGPLMAGVGYAGHENELERAVHRWSARVGLDLSGGAGAVCYGVGYTYATLDGPGTRPQVAVREHRVPATVSAGTVLRLPAGALLVPAVAAGPMLIWSRPDRLAPFHAVALQGGASLTLAAGPVLATGGVTINSNSGIPLEWTLGAGFRL